MDNDSVGTRIKTMRMSRGLSQAQLAKKIGVGQSSVAMWETGQRLPGWEAIDALSDVFNTPPSAIIDGERPDEDRELWDLRETLRRRPEMRTLFSVSKSASKKDVEKAIAIIEALKNVEEN